MTLKTQVLNKLQIFLKEKISILKNELDKIQSEKNEIIKSSVGDKFETTRSLMQVEYDKLQNQIFKLQDQLNKIQLIDLNKKYSKIEFGSLVKTNKYYYLVFLGLGKFDVKEFSVFLISLSSPIGKIIINKKKGESFIFNNKVEIILDIT